jgi:predicted PhzF superfamily epimerase YddE/YHI9
VRARFTPTHEVSLCGHATLATAHVLAAQRDSTKAEQFTFHTLSGPLIATRKNGADDNTYELDFPADDLVAVNSAERGAIETSVHTAVGGRARVVDVHRSGRNDLIVELAMHEGARLQDFDIDLNALVSLRWMLANASLIGRYQSELRGRGVALTTATTSVNETDAHFHSRFFSLSSPASILYATRIPLH